MTINHLIAESVGWTKPNDIQMWRDENGNLQPDGPEFISDELLHEILADVRHAATLIDHHAGVLFPKQPKHRLAFRRAIRGMLIQ